MFNSSVSCLIKCRTNKLVREIAPLVSSANLKWLSLFTLIQLVIQTRFDLRIRWIKISSLIFEKWGKGQINNTFTFLIKIRSVKRQAIQKKKGQWKILQNEFIQPSDNWSLIKFSIILTGMSLLTDIKKNSRMDSSPFLNRKWTRPNNLSAQLNRVYKFSC